VVRHQSTILCAILCAISDGYAPFLVIVYQGG
jgi:hypothetical protein